MFRNEEKRSPKCLEQGFTKAVLPGLRRAQRLEQLLEPFPCGSGIPLEGTASHPAATCSRVPRLVPAASPGSRCAFVCATSPSLSRSSIGIYSPRAATSSPLLVMLSGQKAGSHMLPGPPLSTHLHFLPASPFGVAKAMVPLCVGKTDPVLLLSTLSIFPMAGDSPMKRYKGDARSGSHPLGNVKPVRVCLEKDSAV